ncbi:membrane protein [Borreliella chilensis]|uniref:Multidrug-efflux transporter n=1 Tax=Borreliella chilensis TaxID=1245910 RepID=A0A0A7UVM1_9SPIR|nr:membrane protein [Borreliella chilensis]
MSANKSKARELILNGNLYKVLFLISFPIVITNIIQAFYDLTDMFYVGKLGAMPLSALSLAGPVNFFIMAIAMGMATGSISLISKCIGEGNFSRFSRYAGQLIVLNFVLSLFVTICALFFIEHLLDLLGVKGELKELSRTYFYVTIFGIPIMFLSISITYILNAQGETTLSMVIVLFANIVNFILDPILIFSFNMGITGAAWATLFSKLLTVSLYLLLTYGLNRGLKIYPKDLVLDLRAIKEIFNLGLPSTFGQIMVSLSFFIFNYIVIEISPKFLAAYGLTNTIISFLFLPAMGIGTGIISIVGQNLGAKKINRVGEVLKKGFFISLIILLIINSIVIFNKQFILGLFTNDLEVLNYANNYLLLTTIGTFGYGLQQVFFGGLIGSGRTKIAMIIIFIRLWLIRLPVVFIFQYFGIIENSLGYAFIISNYLAIIILVAFTCTRYWAKPILIKKYK